MNETSVDFILMTELEFAISSIYAFLTTNNVYFLTRAQEAIKQAKKIDFSVKTLAELDKEKETGLPCFIENSHGVGRMLMFLINYYAENYFNNATLTIYNDDPPTSKYLHTNTYKIKLRDINNHDLIFASNAKVENRPYDFDTSFQNQITKGPDTESDTTVHAYDSFPKLISITKDEDNKFIYNYEKPDYRQPSRTLDFKSAFWKAGHKHFVNYILQLTKDGQLCILDKYGNYKQYHFTPQAENDIYYRLYYYWISKFEDFKGLSWDTFII